MTAPNTLVLAPLGQVQLEMVIGSNSPFFKQLGILKWAIVIFTVDKAQKKRKFYIVTVSPAYFAGGEVALERGDRFQY